MADPAAPMHQFALLPDSLLEEILVRLPPKEFRRCRCLSRAWATTLSSDDLIDCHLRVRGKIRLDYDTIMMALVLECCIDKEPKVESEGEFSVEKESADDAKEETPGEDDRCDGNGDEEDQNWREEYRTRDYVEADQDYYIRRAEMEAWGAEQWGKMDFSGITFAGPDDEYMKAVTVPYGALHPRIRQPFMDEEEDDGEEQELSLDSSEAQEEGVINGKHICGREKTQEEVDQEIIAFLRRLRDMDPQPQCLRELDTYRWPWPIQGQEISWEDIWQEHDLQHSHDDGEADGEDYEPTPKSN